MRVRLVTDEAGFKTLIPAWAKLLEEMPEQGPFAGPEFAWCWWRAFGTPGDQLHILVAEADNGVPAGILPLYRKKGRSRLMPLGAPLHADYWNFSVCETGRQEAAKAISAALAELPGWRCLCMPNVPERSDSTACLLAAMKAHGLRVLVEPAPPCMATSFDQHLSVESLLKKSSLPRIVRQSFRRMEEHGLRPDFSIDPPSDPLVDEIIAFDLERGMGSAKCTGFFTSAAAGRFVKLLAASQAARDIRIATLRFDGRLASYLFCFDTPRELQMYFTATDRSLTLYRPGVVLTWLVLRHSMDRGKTSYNFLLGDEEYKRRWRAAPLRQQSIRIYGRSPIAAAMMSGRICLRWVKRRAKDLVSSRSTA